MNSVPLRAVGWRLALALFAASARKPASFRRCASPPDNVGTGWPSLTYSRPHVDDRLQRADHLAVVREHRRGLADGQVQHVGHIHQARMHRAQRLAFDGDLQDFGR
jgi:hypothetical protein